MEECGVRLDVLEPAGTVWVMPGISTEQLTLYLAPYRAADRVAAGGGLAEEDEWIEVVEMGFDTLFALDREHRLHDLKTTLLVARLRDRLGIR